jgi:hypothetical protein
LGRGAATCPRRGLFFRSAAASGKPMRLNGRVPARSEVRYSLAHSGVAKSRAVGGAMHPEMIHRIERRL